MHALVVHLGAGTDPAVGSLFAQGQHLLLLAGLGQLGRQPLAVGGELGQHLGYPGLVLLQLLALLDLGQLLREGGTGQILTSLLDGELGLGRPLLDLVAQRLLMALQLFLFGDDAGSLGSHLDLHLLHLFDHQTQHLLRLFTLVEQAVQVGIDHVGQAAEYAHGLAPCSWGWLSLPMALQEPCQDNLLLFYR